MEESEKPPSPPSPLTHYEVHSLTDADVPSWSAFCASCFAYKANPPPASYFERHFNNDPRRDSGLIRVIKCNDGEITYREAAEVCSTDDTMEQPIFQSLQIVSSIRIFQKTISVGNGKTLEAGGIGEVCTSEQHRKRGLAKRLLLNAIDTMSNERKMQCSLLHASASLTPVYEKSGGYTCVKSKWSVVTVNIQELSSLRSDKDPIQSRLASFPDDTDRLQKLHKDYSEDRFAGCIVRSKEYWNDYVSNEIGENLFVLTGPESMILGWISIRLRNGRYQLREFGLDLDLCTSMALTTANILSKLLAVSLESAGAFDKQNVTTLGLHMPTAIVDEMKGQQDFHEGGSCMWVDWSTPITDEDDIGWMYKVFDSESGDNSTNIIEVVNNAIFPHLIWPSDSF